MRAAGSALVVCLLFMPVGFSQMEVFHMKWENGVLIYRENELDQGTCAPNPKWGASQLRAYGVDVVMNSEKLQPILLCSKVLELAEIPFVVEPGTAGDPPAAEDLAAARELVQAEAEEPLS